MHSNIEEEQKFEISKSINADIIEKALLELGFKKDHIQKQRDIYWDDEDCKITNLKRGLRARYLSGDLHSIEFKSLFVSANGERVVEEINLLDSDNNLNLLVLSDILVNRLGFNEVKNNNLIFEQVFGEYGLRPQMVLNKTRSVYKNLNNNVEASIDLIDGLLPHLELEFVGKDKKQYEHVINKLTNKFGNNLKQVKEGYLDLIAKQNDKILSRQEYADLFVKNYSWNVLPSELEIVNRLFFENNR